MFITSQTYILLALPLTPTTALMKLKTSLNLAAIKFISLDITGTLLVHRKSIAETYSKCAHLSHLPNPPSPEELKQPFKDAYKKTCLKYPCFGSSSGLSERNWWKHCVRTTLELSGRSDVNNEDFDRYFRTIYQYFGSFGAYELLPDAEVFLNFVESNVIKSTHEKYSLGVTTNAPYRTIETVLPMMGLSSHFDWFVSAQDIGVEKPDKRIFDAAFNQASWFHQLKTHRNPHHTCTVGSAVITPIMTSILPPQSLQCHEILHIGDNLATDYCGARAAGFQALYLDRSGHSKVTAYQDWHIGPDYLGKSAEDIAQHTVSSLVEVKELLQEFVIQH